MHAHTDKREEEEERNMRNLAAVFSIGLDSVLYVQSWWWGEGEYPFISLPSPVAFDLQYSVPYSVCIEGADDDEKDKCKLPGLVLSCLF